MPNRTILKKQSNDRNFQYAISLGEGEIDIGDGTGECISYLLLRSTPPQNVVA